MPVVCVLPFRTGETLITLRLSSQITFSTIASWYSGLSPCNREKAKWLLYFSLHNYHFMVISPVVFKSKYWGGKMWWNIVNCSVGGWAVAPTLKPKFPSPDIADGKYIVDDAQSYCHCVITARGRVSQRKPFYAQRELLSYISQPTKDKNYNLLIHVLINSWTFTHVLVHWMHKLTHYLLSLLDLLFLSPTLPVLLGTEWV